MNQNTIFSAVLLKESAATEAGRSDNEDETEQIDSRNRSPQSL